MALHVDPNRQDERNRSTGVAEAGDQMHLRTMACERSECTAALNLQEVTALRHPKWQVFDGYFHKSLWWKTGPVRMTSQ